MAYYCKCCDKAIKLKLKNNHFKSFMHVHFGKYIPISQSIKNPDFFDIDEIFNDYFTKHNKNFDFHFVKCDFKLDFNDDFKPYFKTFFYDNTTISNLKRFL